MNINYFSDKLKAVRKARKMTQIDLANRIGVSKWAITSYEQARTFPSVETLIKICDVLDTSSDYLLGISDKLPLELNMAGLSGEESRLLLQFLNLIEQNRIPKQ
ncbi:Putative HTH-type transcriptional regulator Xre [Pseudolactococcus piscium]|nr:Putative HTH-type transcriptional regulator Xre [Lactococcus piscium]